MVGLSKSHCNATVLPAYLQHPHYHASPTEEEARDQRVRLLPITQTARRVHLHLQAAAQFVQRQY